MDYAEKKRFFDKMITVYGRKPTLEILQDPTISIYRLHLAKTNRSDRQLTNMTTIARQRNIEILYHSREQLSRISKNKRQDQGVAMDIQCPSHLDYRDFIEAKALKSKKPGNQDKPLQLIALDRIANPQNLGMIIRSVCASSLDGLIIPRRGCASLSPLVIKASAGTLFRCPILHCDQLNSALADFAQNNIDIIALDVQASITLRDYPASRSAIYVLGNESDGLSSEILALANTRVSIPMHNEVESLNVAITASLIAFRNSV